MTREEWLNAALPHLLRWFEPVKFTPYSKIRVTCGWPSSKGLSSRGARTVGECWDPACSADGAAEIFISPFLADAKEVLSTLLHEIIHTCGEPSDIEGEQWKGLCKKHTGDFAKCAKALGFEKPWKSTPCGDALADKIANLAATLEPYPHAKLDDPEAEVNQADVERIKTWWDRKIEADVIRGEK